MKTLVLALCCAVFYLVPVKAQNNYWTIGPTITLDRYRFSLPNKDIKGANIDNSLSISYGISLSYKLGRILLDIKGLTSSRTYTYSQGYPITVDPTAISSSRIKARYYIIPITISYLVYDTPKFQFFAGTGIFTESQSGDFIVRSQSEYAGVKKSNDSSSPRMSGNRNGWSLQTIIRYKLIDKLMISVEPTYRYLAQFDVPVGHQQSNAFSLVLSTGYKF